MGFDLFGFDDLNFIIDEIVFVGNLIFFVYIKVVWRGFIKVIFDFNIF